MTHDLNGLERQRGLQKALSMRENHPAKHPKKRKDAIEQPRTTQDMSKLSPALKALINAPFARPATTPAPARITAVYERIGKSAQAKNVAQPAWVAMATGATMTMNSPESLHALHALISRDSDLKKGIQNAELMREVGLKCIGFNGVPRVINCLNAFRDGLPPQVASGLTTTSSRTPTADNIEATKRRGRGLWDSIYKGFEVKLIDKLATAHPDLPVHIVNSEYGLLFSDPPTKTGHTTATNTSSTDANAKMLESSDAPSPFADVPRVGRLLTSIVAVACLRAQTGVGPQVISHIFGLRKALDDGTWRDDESRQNEDGARWLASNDGSTWILESVDEIVEALSQGGGSTYAPGMQREKAKL